MNSLSRPLVRKIKQAAQAAWSLLDKRYRAFFLMRQVRSLSWRKKLAARQAARLPKFDHEPCDTAMTYARILAKDGFVVTSDAIPSQWIADMRSYFLTQPCADPYKRENSFVGPENAPSGTHVAYFDDRIVANAPHALAIANLPLLLDTVATELGAKPTISYITALWSVPANDGTPQHAEKFHRDVDDFDFTKFFVYLSDVDEESGPHVFMKGSHKIGKLVRIRRYTDEEVFAAFGKENEIRLTGSAGTCFLEKTYGMHRGYPPTSKPRLILSVQYSLRPTIYGPAEPLLQCPPSGLPLDPYVNRIYCRTASTFTKGAD